MEIKRNKLYLVYVGAGKLVVGRCLSAKSSQYVFMELAGYKEHRHIDRMNIRREADEADWALYGQ